jgi:NRPS condensation-like uncharacterized protein
MRIDFEGCLDAAALDAALECSCVTLPLIACGFDTAAFVWRRWVTRKEAAREILRVVEAPGRREDEVRRALARTLDVERGPQLQVTLIRDAGQDSLCLLINHMLCDGAGFKQYVSILAEQYSRIVAGLDPSPAPFCPARGIWPVVRGFTPREWIKAIGTSPTPTLKREEGEEPSRDDRLSFESGPPEILTASLPAGRFAELRSAAKAQGFTVNDLLMGALARAWHRVTGAETFYLPCTIDMRAFARPDTSLGIACLSGSCPCLIKTRPSETMEDVITQVVEQMRLYKEGIPGMVQLARWELYARFVPFLLMKRVFVRMFGGDGSTSLRVSNIGIITEDCVRFGDTPAKSAYLFLAAASAPALRILSSTFRGTFTLAFSIEGDEEATAFAQNILALTIEELRSF